MYTGGSCASIVLICNAEVWVRKESPSSKKNVSCMLRAGCPGGMPSAVKL
jgi:hypothetical protein